MNKSILITGVSGSGKSAVCAELKKLHYNAYDIEEVPGLFKMVDKKTGKVVEDQNNENVESVKQRAWICDKNKLQWLVCSNENFAKLAF